MTNPLREVVADALPELLNHLIDSLEAVMIDWAAGADKPQPERDRAMVTSVGILIPRLRRAALATLPTQSAGVEERAFQAALQAARNATWNIGEDVSHSSAEKIALAVLAALRTPASEGDGGRVDTSLIETAIGTMQMSLDAQTGARVTLHRTRAGQVLEALRSLTTPPTQQEARAVDDEMVQRGLDAAIEATYARLARYSVVRAILTAALHPGAKP